MRSMEEVAKWADGIEGWTGFPMANVVGFSAMLEDGGMLYVDYHNRVEGGCTISAAGRFDDGKIQCFEFKKLTADDKDEDGVVLDVEKYVKSLMNGEVLKMYNGRRGK